MRPLCEMHRRGKLMISRSNPPSQKPSTNHHTQQERRNNSIPLGYDDGDIWIVYPSLPVDVTVVAGAAHQ